MLILGLPRRFREGVRIGSRRLRSPIGARNILGEKIREGRGDPKEIKLISYSYAIFFCSLVLTLMYVKINVNLGQRNDYADLKDNIKIKSLNSKY